jgi:MFS family permease
MGSRWRLLAVAAAIYGWVMVVCIGVALTLVVAVQSGRMPVVGRQRQGRARCGRGLVRGGLPLGALGVLVGSGSVGRRGRAFRSLAGNGALLRVLVGYALFELTEYSVWIAMLVYAYGRGGATVAGLVAVAQLVPAAVAAPLVASVADRRSPVVLLAGGYLVQAVAMAGTAAAVIAGVPLAAYAAAVVAATAVTTTRPAQAALIPTVAATADQLTAANVVVGWLEAAGMAVSGLLAGVLISLAGLGSVFVVCAGLAVVAALLVAGLRVAPLTSGQEQAPAVLAGVGEGLRLAVRRPRLRLMMALLTAEAVVLGALDLLIVILAISVLGRPQAWAGYLNFATGVGAVAAATVSAVLVGRRLGRPILGAALILSGALAALALGLGVVGTVALLAVAGAGGTVLDVATRTLLQRSVPPRLIGRVFGLLEGLTMAGYALGALLVPALVYLGGSRLALLGVAAVLPLAAVAGGRALFGLDAEAPVPVVEIALLRSLPLFAELPAPAIEGLAAALKPVHLAAGAVLIRQGEPGDAYYAIAAGELDVAQDGHFLRRCGRGEGIGEIALLRAIPRTATVTAHSAATVYELDRDLFLTAVLGHAPTRLQADRIADTRLATGAVPAETGTPEADTAGPGLPGALGGPRQIRR